MDARLHGRHFDVVVCGAGSAGSVVAGRLAEDPDLRVLLLEAGGDDDREVIQDPDLWPANLGTDATWNHRAQPSDELGGRAIPYQLGRGLGGGGSVNVSTWTRGHEADWRSYAAIAADPDWGPERVDELYRSIERAAPSDAESGTAGPLPLSTRTVEHPLHRAALDAAEHQGLPRRAQHNAMMRAAAGVAPRSTTIQHGRRRSPYRAYVHAHRRPNLTVATGSHVAEVLFRDDVASGVRLDDGTVIHADHQVVLSLGAASTPVVLMRSGVGDRARLQDLGIRVRVHSPRVGENLHDHVLVPVLWSAPSHLELPPPGEGAVALGWDLDESDAMSTIAFVDTAPLVSDEIAERTGRPTRSVTVLIGVRLRSRGRVTLASSRDDATPIIEHGYLTDPADMGAVVRAIRRASAIVEDPALAAFVGARMLPRHDADEEELERFVRDAALTFWHACGTAAMGADDDAVVDSRLRVRGVRHLRIADASVLPHAPVGNTMAPCVIVGEQAARFIRDELAGRRDAPAADSPDGP